MTIQAKTEGEADPARADVLPVAANPSKTIPTPVYPTAATLAASMLASEQELARKVKRRRRSGLGTRVVLLLLALGVVFAALGLTGRPIPMPVWLVAEIEERMNRAVADALPGEALALGGVDITVDSDWVPRLRLEDVQLLKTGGQALITLPDLRLTLDPGALLRGHLRARSLRIIGARLDIKRDANGDFDLSLGAGGAQPVIHNFRELFDAVDQAFASPAAASLTTLEAEALTLTLRDDRSGRTWELGDGHLRLDNRATEVAAELSVSLLGDGTDSPARAVLTVVSEKGAKLARVTAQIDGVASQDIAAQSPPLAWLAALNAPISGSISTTLAENGISAMEARLEFGAGALQPRPEAQPVPFDRAGLALSYNAAQGSINLTDLSVESRTLRLRAVGNAYLTRADGSRIIGALAGEVPDAYLTQLQFSQVMIDPEGLFQEPVKFSQGALDLRLRLQPFSLEIGQLSLAEAGRRLTASGQVGADAQGWRAAVDLALNEIPHDRLVALWPVTLLPNTRAWVARNVLSGSLFDVKAALRIEPGAEPRLHLGYSFANTDVRFINTLPPIKSATGYANIDGPAYTMVMSEGTVTPPEGGQIDVAGSVFAIPDVTHRPAFAEITLKTNSSLTAALSLLDQPPFHFMSKADQPVTLGQGSARIETHLRLPLQKKIAMTDVEYQVAGTVAGFSSDTLVPGRAIRADRMAVQADIKGLAISGEGTIGAVPFDVTFRQGFGLTQKGKSQIEGTVVLSQKTVEEFGLGLPAGMVSGQGQGLVKIDLVRGAPGRLSLVSDLRNIGLALPELGWSKAPEAGGSLEADVRLGKPPRVERLTLDAPGLTATGSVAMRAGGGLEVAQFDRVQMGDWLDGRVEIRGQGAGKPVALAVTAGSVDMRKMPKSSARKGAGGGGSPLELRLDSLRVSSSIALTGFRGDFSLAGGFNGSFISGINGNSSVRGSVVPHANGTAVRLQSDNAGATLAAAGIFASARGGGLDVTLTPRAQPGSYDGHVDMTNLRVRNTNVLADLLNAVSVVGILEQLNGEGLVFNQADADFLLTPNAVEVTRGSAMGASLGVSMAGVYKSSTGELFMQGVISPIYLLNGIGAVLSRRGEGLFGFNYALRGTSANPDVSVNPLSILTPGMFREIFRRPAPVLGGVGQ